MARISKKNRNRGKVSGGKPTDRENAPKKFKQKIRLCG